MHIIYYCAFKMSSRFFIPKSNFDQFELAARINSRSFRMNLIDGQLDVMPTTNSTARKEFLVITHVGTWCLSNPNLVGNAISSQGCYTLPNGDVLGPDTAVVLTARWNALTDAQQNDTYPPVAPNFIVELRTQSDSPQYVHNKMLRWINGGVEEGWSIDQFVTPPEVRVYFFNANTNQVDWNIHINPAQVTSQVLPGFTMNMQGIF